MVQRYEQMRRLQWYKRGAAYLEQRAQGESFLFFLPCSVFSYSINAEEDRSDIDKFVINHIIIGKQ